MTEWKKLLAAATKGPGNLDGKVEVITDIANGPFNTLGDDYGRIEEPAELLWIAWAVNNIQDLMNGYEKLKEEQKRREEGWIKVVNGLNSELDELRGD